jgi:hypothetical protein
MFKEKLIKNICCITGGIMLLVIFFIFFGTKTQSEVAPFELPLVMFELFIASFSLFWSMNRDNKVNLTHILMIMLTVILAFVYVILEALTTVALENKPSQGLIVTTDIFLWATAIGIAWCLFYPIYLDFFAVKGKAVVKEQ